VCAIQSAALPLYRISCVSILQWRFVRAACGIAALRAAQPLRSTLRGIAAVFSACGIAALLDSARHCRSTVCVAQ
tara:strand:- start:1054 stop:1278 length:225 start_codon:yes stop_codon:yes gene_type:complete